MLNNPGGTVNFLLLSSDPWSFSSPAVRITSSCTGSRPNPQGSAGNSPLLRPSPSAKPRLRTATASSRSTSPSLREARPWTWPPSAAPPTAMPVCTPPSPRSARPRWTSASCMSPAPCQAKWQTSPSPGPTEARSHLSISQVSFPEIRHTPGKGLKPTVGGIIKICQSLLALTNRTQVKLLVNDSV